MAASADDEAALDALLSLTKLSKRKRTDDNINYDVTEAEAAAHRTANRARSIKEKNLPIPAEEKLAKQREQVRSDVIYLLIVLLLLLFLCSHHINMFLCSFTE